MRFRLCTTLAVATICLTFADSTRADAPAPQQLLTEVVVPSTIDKSPQRVRYRLPEGAKSRAEQQDQPARPLLVMLHSWSHGIDQRFEDFESEAIERGWIFVFPEFRGANLRPEACGSKLAQQDILDAIDWAETTFRIDEKRIYLTGISGGGHMTMLMAGKYPERFTAASAWVGISNLATWHDRHAQGKYGEMCRACCGGAPGTSATIDAEYHARSPIHFLASAAKVKLPIDIAAGIHDGHDGSVPIRQSLDAFNQLAQQTPGAAMISEAEIAELSAKNGRLKSPRESDQEVDDTLGRAIYCRRYAGASRVTIFEGGHEGIATAALAFLEKHAK